MLEDLDPEDRKKLQAANILIKNHLEDCFKTFRKQEADLENWDKIVFRGRKIKVSHHVAYALVNPHISWSRFDPVAVGAALLHTHLKETEPILYRDRSDHVNHIINQNYNLSVVLGWLKLDPYKMPPWLTEHAVSLIQQDKPIELVDLACEFEDWILYQQVHALFHGPYQEEPDFIKSIVRLFRKWKTRS